MAVESLDVADETGPALVDDFVPGPTSCDGGDDDGITS